MEVENFVIDGTFANQLRSTADKFNYEAAQKIIDSIVDEIIKDCIEAAKRGKYEVPIKREEDKYKKLYTDNAEEIHKHIDSILRERIKSLHLTVLRRSDGTFCSPYYVVSFEKQGKEE